MDVWEQRVSKRTFALKLRSTNSSSPMLVSVPLEVSSTVKAKGLGFLGVTQQPPRLCLTFSLLLTPPQVFLRMNRGAPDAPTFPLSFSISWSPLQIPPNMPGLPSPSAPLDSKLPHDIFIWWPASILRSLSCDIIFCFCDHFPKATQEAVPHALMQRLVLSFFLSLYVCCVLPTSSPSGGRCLLSPGLLYSYTHWHCE